MDAQLSPAADGGGGSGASDIGRPVLLSAIAGSATGVGACIVFFTGIPSDRMVSLALSYAAGVMLTVSLVDLYIPMALKSLQSWALATACAGVGALLCRALGQLRVPEPEELLLMVGASLAGRRRAAGGAAGGAHSHIGGDDAGCDSDGGGCPETGGGGDSPVPAPDDGAGAGARHHHHHPHAPSLLMEEGAAGGGCAGEGPCGAPAGASAGGGALAEGAGGGHPTEHQRFSSWRVGILLAVILTAHNLPEGLAVAAGAQKSHELGLALCAAIFAHNVAEGAVIAIPLLRGLPDRRVAVGIAALTGLSEPLGALVGVLALRRVVSPAAVETAVDVALACVAGIMADVSARELLPLALRHARGEGARLVAAGAAVGAVTIGATLAFV